MIKVNRIDLVEALRKVTKIIKPSDFEETVKGTLVEVEGNIMKLSALNSHTSIISTIECETELGYSDNFIIEAKIFYEIARKLSTDKIEISMKDKDILIKGGRSKFNIVSMGTKEIFPAITHKDGKKEISISSNVFRDLIAKTSPFTVEDNTRPFLSGVKIEFSKNQIKGTSLDGYRLGHYVTEIENVEEVTFLIKANSLSDVVQSIDQDSIKIMFSDESKLVGFDLGNTTIHVQQIEGKFLDYRQILKIENTTTMITLDLNQFKQAMERVTIVAKDKNSFNPTILKVVDNKLVLTSKNNLGDVEEFVDIKTLEGEEMDYNIAFNPTYILGGIKSLNSEEAELRFQNSLSPGYMIEKNDDSDVDFTYLMLPIRLNS